MNRLLAIDPGASCVGWAYFESGVLVRCGLSRAKPKDLDGRAAAHRANLAEFLNDPTLDIVCERMRWRGRKSPGSPQTLIDLNLIAGALGRRWVEPSEWKGSTPREVEQARTQAVLSEAEIAVLGAVFPASLAHNAWSAVGIGLSALDRAHSDAARAEAGRKLARRKERKSKKGSTPRRKSPRLRKVRHAWGISK